jgi:hypothetical protein
MKKTLFILVILFCAIGKIFAQLNESDTIHFQLRASITGNYQQGNVEVLNVRSKLDFTFWPHKNWVFKSQNSSLYQAFFSTKADNDVFSRNYLYYKPQHKLYPFMIAYISTNFRRKINTRYFAGAGLTYQVFNSYKNVLKISASTVYENTKFSERNYNFIVYKGANNIQVWRGTLYVGGWNYFFKKNIRLYYYAYWQPAYDNRNNYRTQIDIGTDFVIWKGFSLNALFAFTHENVVVDKIKKDDKILTWGIAYNLKIK